MKQTLLFAFLVLITYFFEPSAMAYDYPYKDDAISSLNVSVMKSQYPEPFKVIKELSVEIIPGRINTYLAEGRGDFRFYFYPQKKAAPLLFLIADFGGGSPTGYMMYMASFLHKNGYNVITISSPLFWNFIISSSKSGIPGLTSEDSDDMYFSMQKALEKVKKVHSPAITKVGVVGLGLGGLNAAHISSIDQEKRLINIDQYLLINPVMNLVEALTQIETRTAIALELGVPRARTLAGMAVNLVINMNNPRLSANDSTYFENLDQKLKASPLEYKFLSGLALRAYIGETIFASQLINDRGVLTHKATRYKRNARQQEAFELGYLGYLKKIFQPFFAKKYNPLELLKRANMTFVKKSVSENQNIFVMHNQDDFTLSEASLNTLKEMMGSRLKLYQYGGHLGNLWFHENQQDMLGVLESLKK